MRKALVPGTFDPITMGHLDVIKRSSKQFDKVVVGVAASRNKRGGGTLFTIEERVELARAVTAGLDNVEVLPFDNLLVDFARSVGATGVVKGLRATTDFEYEFQMAMLNYRLAPELETFFIMSAPDYMYVSSSIAKELAALGGNTEGIVPPIVAEALERRLG